MPAHESDSVKDVNNPAAMLSVQSKEQNATSLDSKIARGVVTSSSAAGDGQAGTDRYATIQGSKWFRDKTMLTGSDLSKGGTPSTQGNSMKPVALVTSVQSNVTSSYQEGEQSL